MVPPSVGGGREKSLGWDRSKGEARSLGRDMSGADMPHIPTMQAMLSQHSSPRPPQATHLLSALQIEVGPTQLGPGQHCSLMRPQAWQVPLMHLSVPLLHCTG